MNKQTLDKTKNQKIPIETAMNAIVQTMTFIEFKPYGTIIAANNLFLKTFKYTYKELTGKLHQFLVEEPHRKSVDYTRFGKELREVKAQIGEFKHIAKDGSEVWIQASCSPKGTVTGVVKVATDITSQKLINADVEGQIDAFNKSQAVISFNIDETSIEVNSNSLKHSDKQMHRLRENNTLCLLILSMFAPISIKISETDSLLKKLVKSKKPLHRSLENKTIQVPTLLESCKKSIAVPTKFLKRFQVLQVKPIKVMYTQLRHQKRNNACQLTSINLFTHSRFSLNYLIGRVKRVTHQPFLLCFYDSLSLSL